MDSSGAGPGEALAGAIADGSRRRDDVVAGYLAAIEAREDEVRTFVDFDADAFRAAPSHRGSLAGLPVGIKDIIDTVDFPTACGSPIYAGWTPPCDTPLVTMVRRAGGTIAGKTVTTEFAAGIPGKTRNPRNLAHTPGASSSGSAAAVAAGFVPFAIGTQTAASVIRPAAFCGIAALKPTAGLLPTFGIKGLSWSLDTPGLFAATARDLGFFASALTGLDLSVPRAPAPVRFAVARMQAWDEIDAAMERGFATACDLAQEAGGSVVRGAVDDLFEAAYRAQFVIQDFELARALAFEFERHPDLLSPRLRTAIANGLAIEGRPYMQAIEDARRARAASERLFAGADVILAPSASSAAPSGHDDTGSPNLSRLWTLLGLPCVNVPGLTDETGLPLGVQVVGRLGQDRTAVSAAAWLEARIAAR